MVMIRFLPLLLVLTLAGCAGLSDREVKECRWELQYLKERKSKQLEIMNATPWPSLDHRFAYLEWKIVDLEMKPFFHDSKLACWENPRR